MKQKSNQNQKCLTFASNVDSLKDIVPVLEAATDECRHFFARFHIPVPSGQLNEYQTLLDELKSRISSPKKTPIGRRKAVEQSDSDSDDYIPEDNAIPEPLEDSDGQHRCHWPNCSKTFGQQNSLVSHIESYHLRKERFKCCVLSCGRVFTAKPLLKNHMNDRHSNEQNHSCGWTECQIGLSQCLWPKCGQEFPNRQLMDNHMEENHLKRTETNDDKWLTCDHNGCSFQTVSEEEMTEHKDSHKTKYVPINRRKNLTASEASSEPPINKYTGKPLSRRRRPKNFKCSWPACEAAFESQHTVIIHMRKHTGEKPFPCDWPECGKSFRFKGALKLHRESIHLKLKQFKCDECGEGFLLQTALTVHKSKHTGVKKLCCDWPGCDWRTNFSQQLVIHRLRTHEGRKVYLKRYSTKVDPTSPFDSEGKLKPYRCEWPGCERRFRLECNIQPHLKWHQKTESQPRLPSQLKSKEPKTPKRTKERTYHCQFVDCTASYTTKTMLQQHTNTHTGAKPYACKSCPEAFPIRTQLKAHIASTHPSERTFKCPYFGCNRLFDNNRALASHQRAAHESKLKPSSEARDDYSQSSGHSSQPSGYTLPEMTQYLCDGLNALNRLQMESQTAVDFVTAYRRDRMTPTPIPQSTHTTAKRLLINAKRVRNPVHSLANPADTESIIRELPFPCNQPSCWRRFRTVRALDWHLKKFHPTN